MRFECRRARRATSHRGRRRRSVPSRQARNRAARARTSSAQPRVTAWRAVFRARGGRVASAEARRALRSNERNVSGSAPSEHAPQPSPVGAPSDRSSARTVPASFATPLVFRESRELASARRWTSHRGVASSSCASAASSAAVAATPRNRHRPRDCRLRRGALRERHPGFVRAAPSGAPGPPRGPARASGSRSSAEETRRRTSITAAPFRPAARLRVCSFPETPIFGKGGGGGPDVRGSRHPVAGVQRRSSRAAELRCDGASSFSSDAVSSGDSASHTRESTIDHPQRPHPPHRAAAGRDAPTDRRGTTKVRPGAPRTHARRSEGA